MGTIEKIDEVGGQWYESTRNKSEDGVWNRKDRKNA